MTRHIRTGLQASMARQLHTIVYIVRQVTIRRPIFGDWEGCVKLHMVLQINRVYVTRTADLTTMHTAEEFPRPMFTTTMFPQPATIRTDIPQTMNTTRVAD